MPEQFELKNDGARNVRFTGDLVGEAGGAWHNGREQNRFTKLSLYRTTSGKFVLYKEYITRWQGEECQDSVYRFETAAEVYAHFEDADGRLGRIDKELLEDAAKVDGDFAALLVEEVE
jgi:hypothetical protein